ncbi:MAG: hypothetical protein U0354_04350 [Candidatus Sericytochromatia bacterium]
MKIKKNENGWALVVSLLIGALMLSVTAILLSKSLNTTKEIIKVDQDNKKKEITDTIVASSINWMDKGSWDTTNNKPSSLDKNGITFVNDFYKDSSTFSLLDSNSKAQIISTTSSIVDSGLGSTSSGADPTKNFYLSDFLNNNQDNANASSIDKNRALNFLNGSLKKMNEKIKNEALTSSISGDAGKWGLDELPEKLYRKINLEYGEGSNKIKAEARITILPVSTNISNFSEKQMHENATKPRLKSDGTITTDPDFNLIPAHEDIYKLYTKVCFPNCDTNKDVRRVDVLLKRPIIIGSDIPPYAVYADGAIDIQNAGTSSGPTNNIINSTNEGDVHSNTSVTVGSVGSVGGKLTSSGIAKVGADTIPDNGIPAVGDPLCSTLGGLCTTTQVYNKTESKSHVDPVPKPEWDFNPYPTTECNTTAGFSLSPKVFKNCRVTGDLSISGTMKFEGDVYITGKLSSGGGDSIVSQGDTAVRIIVDGKIDLKGNSDSPSTQDTIFVSNYPVPGSADYTAAIGCDKNSPTTCPDAVSIAGTPTTGTNVGALFYTSSPFSNVKIAGTADFFGGVIASGTVTGKGQPSIRRDTDMKGAKGRLPQKKDSLMMKVVSIKETRN